MFSIAVCDLVAVRFGLRDMELTAMSSPNVKIWVLCELLGMSTLYV